MIEMSRLTNQVEVTRNEVLFTHRARTDNRKQLILHKRSYSDGSSFYSLKDEKGFPEMQQKDKKLNDLIEQVGTEIDNYEEHINKNASRSFFNIAKWKRDTLNDLQFSNQWHDKIY